MADDAHWSSAQHDSHGRNLAGAAEEEAGDGLLDALRPEDLGRDALRDQVQHVGLRRKLPDLRLLLRAATASHPAHQRVSAACEPVLAHLGKKHYA